MTALCSSSRWPPPRSARPGRRQLIAAVAFAAGLGAAGSLLARVVLPAPDGNRHRDYERYYRPVALTLLERGALALPDGQPAVRYPPGYPALLAAAFAGAGACGGGEAAAVTALNAASAAVAAGAVAAAGIAGFGLRGGALAGALLALHPFLLWLGRRPNSELPFTALLAVALALAAAAAAAAPSGAWPRAALAGLALGAATLVRPIGLPMALALAVALVLARVRARGRREGRDPWPAVALLLAFACALGPWSWWASRSTGRLVVASTHGVASAVDGLTFAVRRKGYRVESGGPRGARELMAALAGRQAEMRDGTGVLRVLGEEARRRPWAALELAAWKAVRPLYASDSGRRQPLALAMHVATAALLCGALRARRRGALPVAAGTLLGLAAAVTLAAWCASAAVLAIARYLAPATALLGAWAGGALWAAAAQRRRTTLW